MGSIQNQIEALLPKSLDDIIRANRDKLRAYLTTEDELAALRKSVPIRPAKAIISAWTFITLYVVPAKQPLVFLTGYNETEQCTWMTSNIVSIGDDLVVTKSGSLYKLVGDSTDQPDLLHICATLHQWGNGEMFGVPAVFY